MVRLTRYRLAFAFIAFAFACGGKQAESGRSDGGPNTPADVVAPKVENTMPVDGTTSVALDSTIVVAFSEEMSADSVMSSALSISPAVSGSVAYKDKKVTFTPSSALAYDTTYKATIKTSAKDLAGNPLASEFSWSFSTMASPPAPIAIPGLARDVNMAELVELDGSASQSLSGLPLTYTWKQKFGTDVTGGTEELSGAKPTFTAPGEVGTLQFDLVVNDGRRVSAPARVQVNVMEDRSKAIFVTATGNDSKAGTRAEPLKNIQSAIEKAKATGADVYIGAGQFEESLVLADAVSLYGGFDANWVRKPATSVTKVISGSPRAISGSSVGGLVIDGLSVISANAALPGESSYGILLASSSAVTISNNDIAAGNGANGAQGAPGAPGTAGEKGGNGEDGCEDSKSCNAWGGSGGSRPGFAGGAGGQGGKPGTRQGADGASGDGPSGGGGGAGGANEWSKGYPGGDGASASASGAPGSNGADGTGEGVAGRSGYVPVPGAPGGDGSNGSGGGAGGGGGGQNCNFLHPCVEGNGNGGAGGGAGGSGGKGGGRGLGGGGSFGIFLSSSPNVKVAPNNTFHLGTRGLGGLGGKGGAGGAGGEGGSGGRRSTSEIGAGGNGGWGSAGGAGGRGGKGAGGPAKEVFSG